MERAQISFKVGRKQYNIDVAHNLNQHGTSIEAAFENWVHRTTDYSEESFIRYVKYKDKNFLCMSYNQINTQ